MSSPVRSLLLAATSVLLSGAAFAGVQEPASLPTQKEVEQAYAQKQYPQALSMIARLLAVKPDSATGAAKGINRHALYELKGEILLRQKMQSEAVMAFGNASDETKDAKASAVDEATGVLIKKSPAAAYTPKAAKKAPATPPTPIDILDKDSRKLAFKALFDDTWPTEEPPITAAVQGKALPPVLAAVPKAADLHALEIAATGSDEKSGKLTQSLASHAKTLLDESLSQMQSKVDSIKTKATEYIEQKETKPATVKGQKPTIVSKWKERGLTTADSQALQEVIGTATKIDPACAELLKDFREHKADWSAAKTKSDEIRKLAQSVASANYSKVVDRKP